MKTQIKVGQRVQLTKRRSGKRKGNSYRVLSISAFNNKALLAPGVHGKEKWFDLRDLS